MEGADPPQGNEPQHGPAWTAAVAPSALLSTGGGLTGPGEGAGEEESQQHDDPQGFPHLQLCVCAPRCSLEDVAEIDDAEASETQAAPISPRIAQTTSETRWRVVGGLGWKEGRDTGVSLLKVGRSRCRGHHVGTRGGRCQGPAGLS